MCGNDVIYPTPNTIQIDDWIEFQYPFPELNNLRKRMEFLIKTLMIMPSYRYSEFDIKVVRTLRNVLNIEENIIGLPYPEYVGEKPKFLVPLKEYDNKANHHRNRQNRREGKGSASNSKPLRELQGSGNWRKSNTITQSYAESSIGKQMMISKTNNIITKQKTKLYSENGYSEENVYLKSYYSENYHQNGAIPRTINGCSQNGSDSSTDSLSYLGSQDSQSSWDPVHGDLDPATRLLNGLTGVRQKVETAQDLLKKYSKYPDRDIYVLVKPKSILNVRIALGSSKWIFAPQTEKKILHFFDVSILIYCFIYYIE